ncbi:HypC/HybG/HupF family hydrogenase formation chaperone [Variovorax ureilyticus]|uniref:HypC/HybG/HupF family hydrogenase formation chaperone n=1 Tax=Variovorax ureilyticus TaxID=1836198 RepID=A0ABU8VPQ5_9BURK
MCLAIPTRLIEVRPGAQGLVELGGIRKEISIALVPEARVGDYVIVHVGHAIGMIDPQEAERTLRMFGELAALAQEPEARTA